MSMPYELLRAGFPYVKSLGRQRITSQPADVEVGADDVVYVLCRQPGMHVYVRKLSWDDEDLGIISPPDDPFVWPVGIAIDEENHIYVSDEATHRITGFTPDGRLIHSWGELGDREGQLNRPSGIAFDPEGALWVSDTLNHRVQRFTKDGKLLAAWGGFGSGEGQLNMPWGIDLNPLGHVYVSDWRNDRVQKFDEDGRFIDQIGGSGDGNGQFNRPAGLAVDADGDVYVADLGNHRVQMFDREGRYLLKFLGDGTLSRQAREQALAGAMSLRLRAMATGELEAEKLFKGPYSLTVDGQGRMVVVDRDHHRVQVYQKDVIPLDENQIAPPLRAPVLGM